MSTLVRGLTAEQRETLAADGMVRLPAAIPRADAEAMADALWGKLKSKYGIDRTRRETWTKARPTQLGPVGKTGAFRAMASPAVRAAVDDLLGEGGWAEPPYWGLSLVCFPGGETGWAIPRAYWHLDGPGSAQDPPIARVFAILAPLGPGGGGTAYLAGSHRLIRRLAAREGRALNSAAVKRLLQREPWAGALFSEDGAAEVRRFMAQGGVIDGVPVRVGEMTGEPGDVFLMHPLMLHAAAPNLRDTPRLVLTQWIYGKGWDAA